MSDNIQLENREQQHQGQRGQQDQQLSEEEAERQHWINVMRTFLLYGDFVLNDLVRRQQHLGRLSDSYASHLPRVSFDKWDAIKHASEANQIYFDDMVEFHFNSTCNDPSEKMPKKYEGPRIHPQQHHRNQAVLHSVVREWSESGSAERSTCFQRLLTELQRVLPVHKGNAHRQRVLVPGSGLGRLPLEIAAAGYASEGNEFSAFMAVASNFMLNGVQQSNSYTLYPWIESVCNIVKVQDTLEGMLVPDVAAVDLINSFDSNALPDAPADYSTHSEAPRFPKFSFSAGDFNTIYRPHADDAGGGADLWDAVVTCFFMDTAPVVIEYIETINLLLRPGGIWINQGPLLYHWVSDAEGNRDERYDQSIELSYEELKHVIESFGFVYLKEEWQECNYTRFNKSMMWTVYRTIFFTVQKPHLPPPLPSPPA